MRLAARNLLLCTSECTRCSWSSRCKPRLLNVQHTRIRHVHTRVYTGDFGIPGFCCKLFCSSGLRPILRLVDTISHATSECQYPNRCIATCVSIVSHAAPALLQRHQRTLVVSSLTRRKRVFGGGTPLRAATRGGAARRRDARAAKPYDTVAGAAGE